MEEHLEGVPKLLHSEIVARFTLGYFLENIAVRSNRTLLVTNMIVGQIFYVDPRHNDPESTIQLIHDFNTAEAPPEDDEETGKVTTHPPWPALNGPEYFTGQIFGTVIDRGTLVKMQVDETGEYKSGSLELVVNQFIGDDFAFYCERSAYVATDPAHTVSKFVQIATEPQKGERLKILGGLDKKETAGRTVSALGRGENDSDCIYVVTCGGVVNPIGNNGSGQALIAKVRVGVTGEAC
ncbi:hypothetical protein BELL_0115g00160 [Botrytis elliptica]|uniref:Uncharacterized protein n=1 Tax=Botrytis elliptica TaxID=278938 RepID=A0A4Z1JVS6_9HELO|nr:hypothetical protein BELL_0115g00160 [Botrytis elliptica]